MFQITQEHKYEDEYINEELEYITGENCMRTHKNKDGLVVLKQLPAPIFALDTLQIVLSMMARDVVFVNHIENVDNLNLVNKYFILVFLFLFY